MKFPSFEYRRPSNLEDVTACLEGDETRLLAGGQSLLPLMAFRLARPRVLVDLGGVGELRGIDIEEQSDAIAGGGRAGGSGSGSVAGSSGEGRGGGASSSYLVVGAMTTHAELRSSALVAARLPVLRRVAAEIGHPAIRHLGTIGGSLAHADPAAEWPATCIALGAEVEVHSAAGRRRLPVERLVLGPYQTALEEGELLCTVRFPLRTGMSSALAEVARRPGDFALAGAVCTLWWAQSGAGPLGESTTSGDALVSGAVTLFGVTGRPLRLELPYGLLAEPRLGELSAFFEPHLGGALVDHQADGPFRRHLAAVVAGRAIRAAAASPSSGAPSSGAPSSGAPSSGAPSSGGGSAEKAPAVTVAFRLNGASVELEASRTASLADVLRDELHAYSVHLGCEQGVCGACTVLLDGRVARSCLMVAGQAEGRSISTSEGAPERLGELWRSIESAFVERGAFQCGFCTSGMIACLEELLLAGEPVTRGAVLEQLSGQICRCTGYLPLLEVFGAVLAEAGLLAGDDPAAAAS